MNLDNTESESTKKVISEIENLFIGFEKVYTDVKSPGTVWRHELVKETVDDYVEVYEIATDFAKLGRTVKILPILNFDNPLRDSIFIGAKENKCPDLWVDGEFVDVKTPLGDPTLNSIDNNIRKAHKQADFIVIRVAGEIEYWKLEFASKKRFQKHESLHTIIFKVIGKKTHAFRR